MPQIEKHNKYLIYVVIFAFIIYQLVNFIYFPISTRFPDESRFLDEAIKFANTGEFWVGNSRAWEMPLTAIVYGFIYKIFNNVENTIICIRVTQSLMLVLQAFLIYKISLMLFKDRSIAIVSFSIVLFYPFFIFYQALLLSETIFITILLLAFYFIYRWYNTGFTLDYNFIFANIFLTFSLYSKGTLSYFPPLLITIFYFLNKYDIKNTLKIFVFSILIFIIVMSSWWIRNYKIFGSFVPFTTSSYSNLYLGANEFNTDAGVSWAKYKKLDFVNNAMSIENELERNEAFKQKALEFIKNDTSQYMNLMWLKFKRFYNFTINAKKYDKLSYNLLSIFSYGLVVVFALLTSLLLIKRWKEFSAIYLMITYFTFIHIIFIASIRYRLPIEQLFILLSSYSIIYCKRKIFNR